MFERLSDRTASAVFIVVVLAASLGTATIAEGLVLAFSPLLVVLLLLLVVTREGYSRDGWRRLGVTTLGLRTWPLAIATTAGVNLVAIAAVVALGLARFTEPAAGWWEDLLVLCATGPVLAFAEEIGWRGYLQPRLAFLGRSRAMVLIGVVWIAWHLPYILLTPYYHAEGDRAVVLVLFSASVIAFSVLFGHLRTLSGSVWPAVLAHFLHNATFAVLGTHAISTERPVLVHEYLAGDTGLFVFVATAVCAVTIALSRRVRASARR